MDQDADYVKTVVLARTAVAVDPALGGFGQFALFSAVDGFDRIAKVVAVAGFDLNKGDQAILFGHQVNIAAARAIAAGKDLVATTLQKARGDPLTQLAEVI